MFGEPSSKVFPLLRITGPGFLRIGRKFLKSRELGRVSSRTGVGIGSVRGFSDHTLGKERAWVYPGSAGDSKSNQSMELSSRTK